MTIEKQLVEKTFYETFMTEDENVHPVQVLGELYVKEQRENLSDLSPIRFAQGEVYFHHQDFEAAIYKWENVTNELVPWAQKNMADAYFEIGFLSTAEGIYNSITAEDMTLNTEIALQLISLYIEQANFKQAKEVIKNVVSYNPDYPNVTEIARAFFEEHKDWSAAIELAVNEALRTEKIEWFDILRSYIDKGLTITYEPDYFNQILTAIYSIDQARFEQMVSSLWNSYKDQESYLMWIQEFNNLFLKFEINQESWHELALLYEETYVDLINGKYFIKELSEIIPNLLTNWLRIVDVSKALFASAAVLAWNEIFPSTINESTVTDAGQLLLNSKHDPNGLDNSLHLFQQIKEWATSHNLEVGQRLDWMVNELLDQHVHYLLVTGTSGNGRSSFINSLLQEKALEIPHSTAVIFKNGEHEEISEITDEYIQPISNVTDAEGEQGKALIECKLPGRFLGENELAIITTPSFNGIRNRRNEAFNYLHFADGLLFVLNAASPFTNRERDILVEIQDKAPNLPIHFVLNQMDVFESEEEAAETVNHTISKIKETFPNANVLPYSAQYEGRRQLDDLTEFLTENFKSRKIKEVRSGKVVTFIRQVLTYLTEKRKEMENSLRESIQWNEEMVTKLNGAIHQLSDLEKDKILDINNRFLTIKEEMKKEMLESIPKLLQGASSLIKENSDFRKIHLELNEEMNNRVQDYLQNTLLPKVYRDMQQWINDAKADFDECKSYLDEMSEGFNKLYGEKRMELACDFQVLDDWRRDTDRMTSGVPMDKINIFLRFSPSRFLLKSAGKLLGGLSQNKTMLYNKYKKFIEQENYKDTAESVTKTFLLQFELFEKALERDVSMFFKNPFAVLTRTVEETHLEIQKSQDTLDQMEANKELFTDPMTLFELKLRQNEWMMGVIKEVQYV
ncbi:GTP-binding protein [Fictibacillus gelatini]|uniref:GTP-binding protein n=1 Tax=Fictibacillus gelatini TaxID=225985 RepID=UPI0003FA9CD9|nr:GTP-binding protein [Fictibacillus gelatini]